jgi:hypothetical protein
VLRGGSWNNNARNARAAYRNANQPDNLNNNYGFRVVLAAHDSALAHWAARPANPRERGERIGGRGPVHTEPARHVPG